VDHIECPDLQILLTTEGSNLVHPDRITSIQPLVQRMYDQLGQPDNLVLFRQKQQGRKDWCPVL
jgi:hypothetical protein